MEYLKGKINGLETNNKTEPPYPADSLKELHYKH
jgi:hypothetical protein